MTSLGLFAVVVVLAVLTVVGAPRVWRLRARAAIALAYFGVVIGAVWLFLPQYAAFERLGRAVFVGAVFLALAYWFGRRENR